MMTISVRKLRKERIRRLAEEFFNYEVKRSSKIPATPEEIMFEFIRFCAIENINTPQLKSLRDAIIFEIDNILNERAKTDERAL